MYDLRLIIAAVAGLAAFGFGLFAGYKFEAGKVSELQAQIQTYRNTAQTAEDRLKTSQQEIDAKLAQKEEDFKQRMTALQVQEDEKRNALQKVIDDGATRAAGLKTQIGSLNVQLIDMRTKMKSAPPEERAALQAQVDQLVKERANTKQEMRSEKCLEFPIPKRVIDELNGVKS